MLEINRERKSPDGDGMQRMEGSRNSRE
jgi:hypothetical protein